MRGSVAIVVLVGVLVAGCGDETPAGEPSTTPSTTPTSTTTGIPHLDLADSGTTVELEVGGTASITLVDSFMDFGEPLVEGDAVTISEDISDSSAGRSWTVTAREPGEATISIGGSPTCRSATPPCGAPDQLWSARFVVR